MSFFEKRRDFLKFFFLGTVTSLITPHKLLGFVKPFLRKNGNEILGIYGISLDDYPELIPIWGSVRIKIENTLMFYPKVIIVHVPKEEYEVDFIAISERCPHEGYPIKDLDPDLHLFECSGHGTLFDVTGKYVWGPASRDLERLHLEYDGDKTIYLEVPLYPLNKLDEKEDVLAFLNQNKPNPCENYTTIVFGTSEPAEVNILLFDQKGNEVMLVFSGKCISHYNELLLDVSKLSIGNYFLKMIVNGKPFATRKVIIAR